MPLAGFVVNKNTGSSVQISSEVIIHLLIYNELNVITLPKHSSKPCFLYDTCTTLPLPSQLSDIAAYMHDPSRVYVEYVGTMFPIAWYVLLCII